MQRERLDVYKLNKGRPVEHPIRNALFHSAAKDGQDDVLDAFDLLDIHCGVDVHACLQQFFDVLISLHMAGICCIGMRQVVDQDQLWAPCKAGVQIQLLNVSPVLYDLFASCPFERLGQLFCLRPLAV